MKINTYTVVSGYGRIETITEAGHTMTVRHLIAGDVVVESDLERVKPIFPFSYRPVNSMIALARLIEQRARDEELMLRNSLLTIYDRVVPQLEWLYANTPRGFDGENGERCVRINQNHLASDVHTDRPTMNKQLKRLEYRKIIECRYGHIVLPPLAAK